MQLQLELPPLPSIYQQSLDLVRQVLGSPKVESPISEFIAGGAIRDLILGLPTEEVKDIDIFCFHSFDKMEMFNQINSGSFSGDWEWTQYAEAFPEIKEVQFFYDNEEGESSKVIASNRVLIHTKQELKIDIILLKDQDTDIFRTLDSFDLGFVKCAHSGQSYILHQDFLQDIQSKIIRVCANGAYEPDSIRKRLDKFSKRFPDWSIDDSRLEGVER